MSSGRRRTGAEPNTALGRFLTDAGISGISAFLGIMAVYLVLFALFVLQLFEILTGGTRAAGAAAGSSPVGAFYGLWGLLVALIIGLLVGVFLTFFFAVFVFVSLHSVDIEFVLSATGSVDPFVGLLPVSSTVTGTGTLPITAETLAIPFAELGLVLPPLVLFWYGAVVGAGTRSVPDLLGKPVALVLGYGLATAVATLGATWLFNLVVADLFVAILSVFPVVQSAELTVVLRDFPRTALRMCVGYPLVFGGAGALVGLVSDRLRDDEDEFA
ncbi:hypothetical protein [Halorientalis regularis]|jgi:hypothetical protein|uniref:Uncharacterized protein n=1 Tax=Halorientalis regularis TaxID=660518 RepID=A0A1G7IWR9_9EURY|nr:hypothetical protein [Halorientalis regularis]SDF17127.1 hypothetical protein SAMN05216218_104114 [Halorientalis regularis]